MKAKLLVAGLIIIGIFYWLPQPLEVDWRNESAAQQFPEGNFLLRNVTLYDGEQWLADSDVLVVNKRIAKIGKGLKNNARLAEIDGRGKTLIPGLVDAHTHVWGEALSEALNFGIMTELDMFTSPQTSQPLQSLRDQPGNTQAADLFSATILATAPRGHGTEYGIDIPVLEQASQVESFVTDRIADGADYIKAVYLSTQSERQFYPSISFSILKALAESAHRHEKLLVVHVDNFVSAKEALQAGADGLVHSFLDQVVDQAFIDLMLANKAFMIPTLSVEASVAGLNNGKTLTENRLMQRYLSMSQSNQLKAQFMDFGIPTNLYQNALTSVALLNKAGVPILAGSDAPNPGTSHGVSLHDELSLLVDAGLTPSQALHAATGAAGKIFPIGQRGTIQKGAFASMVLLESDPRETIHATQNIAAIWKNGVHFKRKKYDHKLAAEAPLASGLISDFNTSDTITAFGAGISTTSDKMAGGTSSARMLRLNKSSTEDDFYIQVSGEIQKGFAFPWGGIGFLPGQSLSKGANLEALEYITFDALGSNKSREISVLVFQAGSFKPSVQSVSLDERWRTFRIKLDAFAGIDLHQVVNISLVVMGNFGEYEFAIDNLKFE